MYYEVQRTRIKITIVKGDKKKHQSVADMVLQQEHSQNRLTFPYIPCLKPQNPT